MKRVRVDDLAPTDRLLHPLFHESGGKLHSEGDMLTQRHIELLRKCGIDTVYEIENPHDQVKLQQKSAFRAVKITSLTEGMSLASPIYSLNRVLLLQANVAITGTIKERLIDRGYHDVYVKKTAEELKSSQAERYAKERAAIEDIGGLLKAVESIGESLNAPGTAGKSAGPALPARLERRKFKRFRGGCAATFIVQKRFSSMWDQAVYAATVKDISKGGICLVTHEALARGQKVKLTIAAEERGLRIAGICEIVRINRVNAHFEAAARFLYVGAEKKPSGVLPAVPAPPK